jgi:replication-associated recombination protein RarA
MVKVVGSMEKEKKELKTKRGYDFYVVVCCLQKAIRRNDPKIAGFFAFELLESGYYNYVWKRLVTISAEDCHGVITQEIMALWEAFEKCHKKEPQRGRIFLSKAVILLCQALKNRDADHLICLVYDKGLIDDEAEKFMEDIEDIDHIEVPKYAYDVHTLQGKKSGKTRKDFFKTEFEALRPRQLGLFDEYVYK